MRFKNFVFMRRLSVLIFFLLFYNFLFSQISIELVKEINPTNTNTAISFKTEYGGKVYFAATDSLNGGELWRSDGTFLGTELFFDFSGPYTGSMIREVVEAGGLLFIGANDGLHGDELWVTNGTVSGTQLIDINPSGSSSPRYFTVLNNRLYFFADDGVHGRELWSSVGTLSGTQLICDIIPGSSSYFFNKMMACNGLLYMGCNHPILGSEVLYYSDGTCAGTSFLFDFNRGSGSSSFSFEDCLNNVLFLDVVDSNNSRSLYSISEQDSITRLIHICDPSCYKVFTLTPFPNDTTALITAAYSTYAELWSSSGRLNTTNFETNCGNYQGQGCKTFRTFRIGELFYFLGSLDNVYHHLLKFDPRINQYNVFFQHDSSNVFTLDPIFTFSNAVFMLKSNNSNFDREFTFVMDSDSLNLYTLEPSGAINLDPFHNFTSGSYFVSNSGVYISANFNYQTDQLYIIRDPNLGLQQNENEFNLKVFPNPISNNRNLSVQSEFEIIFYQIFDISGTVVQQRNFNFGTSDFSISILNLSAGFYTIKFHTLNGHASKKIIVL